MEVTIRLQRAKRLILDSDSALKARLNSLQHQSYPQLETDLHRAYNCITILKEQLLIFTVFQSY
jgi:hypothetical protein